MGTMNKMRENTGVVLWILVFAFGIIWVLQDSGALDVVGAGGANNIIVVDGDGISYDEYARAIDAQVQQYQQQTGESMPPQMIDQQREAVFQQLVENKLREHEMDRLGISVTDEEIYDMVMGPNPHSIIKVYFGDQQGNVDRALLQNFIQNPEARQDWIQIENYLRAERRREKMDNLISATVRVSDQDVISEHRRRSLTVDAQWVGLRYADISNDSVTVTDRDISRYYEENKEDYERKRTYRIKYVTRTKQPSPQDSSAIVAELNRLKPRFAEAADDSLFITRNASEQPFNDVWVAASGLEPQIAAAIFENPAPGRIIGPLFSGNQAHLIKIRAVQPSDQEAVRARHILLRSAEEDEQIRNRLIEIKNQVNTGADFAELARQHSQDGSAAAGGDLGWFGRGQMVTEFEQAAFGAREGEVVGPIKTRFGYHLIMVTDRANQEVKIADYALEVRPDVATLNNMQEQLEDLRYFAEESDDFEAEAQRLGLDVQEVQIEEEQQVIPGLGNSRTLLNFLTNAKEGTVSPVIELNDVFIVASVEEILPEGYRPLDEVRAEIEPRVYVEKKKELLTARVQRALQSSGFDGLARALGTAPQTASSVSFNTNVIPGLGRDPKFVGTVLGLEKGETSGVVAGENAVFVARVTNVTEPPAITEAQRNQIRDQLLQSRRARVRSQWLAELKDKADIQDLRSRYQQQ